MLRNLLLPGVLLVLGACDNTQTQPKNTLEATPAPSKEAHLQRASILNAETSYNAKNQSWKISWKTAPLNAPVSISVANNPDFTDAIKLTSGLSRNSYQLPFARPSHRTYFRITPQAGDSVTTALRVLPLEGGRNFRDLGGYKTNNGKTVKWGKAFRSGTMHGLTEQDHSYLSNIGVNVICDFRTEQEREHEPTNWKAGPVSYLTFEEKASDDGSGLMSVFSKPGVTPEDVGDVMEQFYHHIAYDHAHKYKEMFHRLANGEVPLAFNCSAGKDRAGTGAALLLTALGVPRETVITDYAMSEKIVDYMAIFTKKAEPEAGAKESPYAFLSQLPPELIAPLMRSDPKFIRATFSQLEADHGSVLAFIQNELDVDDAELTRIRNYLLH